MVDIFLEVTGSFFAAIIFFTALRGLHHHAVREQPGTRLVVAGFGLLFFGMLIDITDNFPALNYLVVIGDTEPQAFLEKVVGMLLGLLLLALGLRRWIPSIMELEEAHYALDKLNVELDQRVRNRTLALESANKQLSVEIAERSKAEAQLKYRAAYDSLTGLYNRYAVNEYLDSQVSCSQDQKRFCAVMLLDLDDFKKVNDHLGHEIGDRLLVQAAQRLADTLPDASILGRIGGDEFIIILSDLDDVAVAGSVAEMLLTQFRSPFVLTDRDFLLTVSIGIGVYPRDGETSQELLRHADTAMYCAKREGRNTYCYFSEQMNRALTRRLALEEQMQGALGRQEFSLRYQPVIDLKSQRIIGAEALLRWQNPVLGNVPPDEFIPVAEQMGLIVAIGQFVLTTALQNTVRWREWGDGVFKIAVNISPLQFRDLKLVDFIAVTLQQFNLPGKVLDLEITEGVLMCGNGLVDDALAALHEMDIGLSMDDFGTGYSSLSYLRQYPFDILKIDRSFVSDIPNNQEDSELVRATISMAHSLGLKVVAEGVETVQQLIFLNQEHCDLIQGYYFSPPLLDEEFDQFMANWPSPVAVGVHEDKEVCVNIDS